MTDERKEWLRFLPLPESEPRRRRRRTDWPSIDEGDEVEDPSGVPAWLVVICAILLYVAFSLAGVSWL